MSAASRKTAAKHDSGKLNGLHENCLEAMMEDQTKWQTQIHRS